MSFAAKCAAFLAQSVVSVSTKLSIASVIGLALIALLPQHAASIHSAAARQDGPAAPVALVRAKPVPVVPGPPGAMRPAEDSGADSPPTPPIAVEPADSAPIVLAARRARRERRERVEEKAEPVRRNSAISMPEPAQIPAPETKPETAQAEPPKPDVWSDAEVIAALKECVKLLAPIAAEVEVSEPVKHAQCGTPAPLLLRRVGSGARKVEINPPAMLNCAMVAHLHQWVEHTLQPAAQEAFGSPIARLRNASGYSCRNRNGGSHAQSEKLSEHALANAIDIAGFVTADGRTVNVADHWGPTARDQREAERVAALRAKEAKEGKDQPAKAAAQAKAAGPVRKDSAISQGIADRRRDQGRDKTVVQTADLRKPGRTASDVSGEPKAIPATAVRDEARKTAEGAFLRRLHKGACGTFGTVLGPEANEAHRDHFHFDLAARKRNAFCE